MQEREPRSAETGFSAGNPPETQAGDPPASLNDVELARRAHEEELRRVHAQIRAERAAAGMDAGEGAVPVTRTVVHENEYPRTKKFFSAMFMWTGMGAGWAAKKALHKSDDLLKKVGDFGTSLAEKGQKEFFLARWIVTPFKWLPFGVGDWLFGKPDKTMAEVEAEEEKKKAKEKKKKTNEGQRIKDLIAQGMSKEQAETIVKGFSEAADETKEEKKEAA